jgi:hypothetical protein
MSAQSKYQKCEQQAWIFVDNRVEKGWWLLTLARHHQVQEKGG